MSTIILWNLIQYKVVLRISIVQFKLENDILFFCLIIGLGFPFRSLLWFSNIMAMKGCWVSNQTNLLKGCWWICCGGGMVVLHWWSGVCSNRFVDLVRIWWQVLRGCRLCVRYHVQWWGGWCWMWCPWWYALYCGGWMDPFSYRENKSIKMFWFLFENYVLRMKMRRPSADALLIISCVPLLVGEGMAMRASA